MYCLSSLDLSEIFLLQISSIYIYIMQYLNFFFSCSTKNLTLAPVSHLFTIKSDVNFLFTSFNFHNSGLPSVITITENQLHFDEKYCFHNCII